MVRLLTNLKILLIVLTIFFVNVGPETEKSVPKVNLMSPEKFLGNRNQFNFIIVHISEDEILGIIKNLPNKWSCKYST